MVHIPNIVSCAINMGRNNSRRKNTTAVVLKTGHFDNIDSTDIMEQCKHGSTKTERQP